MSSNRNYILNNNKLTFNVNNYKINGSYYLIITNKYNTLKLNTINIKYKAIPNISNIIKSLTKISGVVVNTDKSSIIITLIINKKTFKITTKTTKFSINISSAKLKKGINYSFTITANNGIFKYTYNGKKLLKSINLPYNVSQLYIAKYIKFF